MTGNIFIIEDDERIAEMLVMFLREFGYSASAFYTAGDAIQALQENEADLILLDIMLPDISGLDACPQIRRLTRAPIIFMSANLRYQDAIRKLKVCGETFISKPLDIENLARMISQCLHNL